MQLKISTDYAIRIVLYLAITQTAATSAEISAQMGIPQTVIATLAPAIAGGGHPVHPAGQRRRVHPQPPPGGHLPP